MELNQAVDNKSIEKLQYDLVRDNLLQFEDLERAREIAQVQNINLGQALINSGLIKEDVLLKFLENKLHIPYVDLETFQIDKKCLQFISYNEAYKYRILPLFEIEGTLTVAMSDPLNLFAIDNIIERTGKLIEPVVSSEKCATVAIELINISSIKNNIKSDEMAKKVVSKFYQLFAKNAKDFKVKPLKINESVLVVEISNAPSFIESICPPTLVITIGVPLYKDSHLSPSGSK